MERYICIHGHFYQPSRENAWLEAIEQQDSAYPYHDWNERITAESYAPNATSRILDGEEKIVHIVNNYAKISFNFGPTLLSWMAGNVPDVYQLILEADRESQERFSGHGSAMAQAYNHMIMPLANRRDQYTQVLWGMRDFEYRFGRRPEGMWLPETAVDLQTLDIMAELGIKFTVLAHHQARRVRPLRGRAWREVRDGRVDPSMAYLQRLPSGRVITIFFYDGPISRAVAFEGLLANGERFAERLLGAFSEARTWPQLVHIATDGETYGHHHRHGDMALAYALHYLEANRLARLTNYGEYLEKHPPTHQVEILEHTSWSCAHGVERWRSHCGCNSGRQPEWNQAWRAPLRAALDWLRDTLALAYGEHARQLLRDPWTARNDYIAVILDHSPEMMAQFLQRHAMRPLSAPERVTVLKLLELQRHAMLMYTSCGWFFDELSGIETVQAMHYAGRAVQLAQELFGGVLEARFLERLEHAKSNVPVHRDGRAIYEKCVKPAVVNWEKVGAHYAVNSLFADYTSQAKVYCYTVDREDYQPFEIGRAKLVIGRGRFTSEITQETAVLSFGALHLGDHNVNGGVQEFQGDETYQLMLQELAEVFARADFPEVIRLFDRHFGESTYSIRSLFRDEQRKVLNVILEATLASAEAEYRQLYQQHVPLIRFFSDLDMPLPRAIHTAAEFILNVDLRRALDVDDLDVDRIQALFDEAQHAHITLDEAGLGYALGETLYSLSLQMLAELATTPTDLTALQRLETAVDMVHAFPGEVDLWQVQNIYYRMLRTAYARFCERAEQGDDGARAWRDRFMALGHKLDVRVV